MLIVLLYKITLDLQIPPSIKIIEDIGAFLDPRSIS